MKRRELTPGLRVEDAAGTELVVLSGSRWKKHPYTGYGRPTILVHDGGQFLVYGYMNPKGRSMVVAAPNSVAVRMVSPDDLYPLGTYAANVKRARQDAHLDRSRHRVAALEDADLLRGKILAFWGCGADDVLARVGDTGDIPTVPVLLNMKLAADLGRIRYARREC